MKYIGRLQKGQLHVAPGQGGRRVVYSERNGWLAAVAMGGLPVGLIYNTGTRDYFPVQEEWIQCLVGAGI